MEDMQWGHLLRRTGRKRWEKVVGIDLQNGGKSGSIYTCADPVPRDLAQGYRLRTCNQEIRGRSIGQGKTVFVSTEEIFQ